MAGGDRLHPVVEATGLVVGLVGGAPPSVVLIGVAT
jgi:hypothetical protein